MAKIKYKITGAAKGETTITFKGTTPEGEEVIKQLNVSVKLRPTALTPNETTVSVAKGMTKELPFTTNATTVTFESDHPEIATVAPKGADGENAKVAVITGVGAGDCNITAKATAAGFEEAVVTVPVTVNVETVINLPTGPVEVTEGNSTVIEVETNVPADSLVVESTETSIATVEKVIE